MPASSDRNNNNSAEEEQQQHSSVASRYRSDEGAIFSSSKCPPAPGPQNGCGLPFGFLWTPLAPPTTTPTTHPTTTTGGLKSDSDGIPDDAIEGLPAGVICITCLAYLNLYCDVDRHTGRWKCALCQSDNVLTQEPTDGGALPLTLQGSDDWLSRREVFFQQPLRERIFLANSSSSPSSSHSRAAWNMTHRIVLVVDQNLPASEVHAIGAAMQQQQQQQYRNNNNTADWTTIEMEWGLIVFGKTVQLYHLGADALAAADVIQRSSLFPSPNDLAATQQQHHSPDTYRRDYATSATEHSTDHSVYLGRSVDTLLTCLTACFGLVRTGNTTSSSSGTGNSFDPSHASLQLASAAEEADPRPKSRLEILKERKQARLQNQEDASATASSLLLSPNSKVSPSSNTNAIPSQSPWVLARKRAAASAPPHRCTGRAIQIAIDLMSIESPQSTESFAIAGPAATISSSRSSGAPRQNRILLFTNGCPNLGDGSVVDMQQNKNNNTASSSGNAAYSTVDTEKLARASEFFDLITKEASESNIGIDVFGTGVSELGLPVYQSLTEPSSGYVLLHDTFTSLHLLRNLQFVLQQTHLISAQYFPETNRNSESSPQEQLAIQSPFQEGTWLDACSVDIRMSRFVICF